MNTSPTLTKIAPALLKAQASISHAVKDSKNPHYKNTYADINAVIEAVKPALNAQDIFFSQTASPSEDGRLHITTRLLHTSGEWMEDTAVCPLPKADPQGFGSAMTYMRRYSLASFLGLPSYDDDGEGAKPQPPSQKAANGPETPSSQHPDNPPHTPVKPLATDEQLDALAILAEQEAGKIVQANARRAYKVANNESLFKDDAEKVIKRCKEEIAKAQASVSK